MLLARGTPLVARSSPANFPPPSRAVRVGLKAPEPQHVTPPAGRCSEGGEREVARARNRKQEGGWGEVCASRLRSKKRTAPVPGGFPGQGPLFPPCGSRAPHGNGGAQPGHCCGDPRAPAAARSPAENPSRATICKVLGTLRQVPLSPPPATPLRHSPGSLLPQGARPPPAAADFVSRAPAPRPAPRPVPPPGSLQGGIAPQILRRKASAREQVVVRPP